MLPPLIGDAATRVSADSRSAPNCTGGTLGGIEYRNAEVEAHAAANPVNEANIVALWQQDRWSTGLASANEAIVRTMELRIPGWRQYWNKHRSVR